MNTCRLGSSQWCIGQHEPEPAAPAVVRRPASRSAPERTSSIQGTSATYANHHRAGAGKASTGSAPARAATTERRHGEASQ